MLSLIRFGFLQIFLLHFLPRSHLGLLSPFSVLLTRAFASYFRRCQCTMMNVFLSINCAIEKLLRSTVGIACMNLWGTTFLFYFYFVWYDKRRGKTSIVGAKCKHEYVPELRCVLRESNLLCIMYQNHKVSLSKQKKKEERKKQNRCAQLNTHKHTACISTISIYVRYKFVFVCL